MDEKQRLANVEKDVNDLKTRVAVAESSIKEIKADVSDIKGNTTWILRILVGGLVGGAIAFIISGGMAV